MIIGGQAAAVPVTGLPSSVVKRLARHAVPACHDAQHTKAAIRCYLDLVDPEKTAHGLEVPHIRRIDPGDNKRGGKQDGQPQRPVTKYNGAGDQHHHGAPDNPAIGRNKRDTFGRNPGSVTAMTTATAANWATISPTLLCASARPVPAAPVPPQRSAAGIPRSMKRCGERSGLKKCPQARRPATCRNRTA